MLLLDRSGSMLDDGGNGQTRWDVVVDALIGPGAVVTEREDSIPFGAAVYDIASGVACPAVVTTDPELDNHGTIRQFLRDNGPRGGTPTGEAMSEMARRFPVVNTPRVIVLATDGEPDTCENPNANDPPIIPAELEEARERSRQGVRDAYNLGIQTFVLGIALERETLDHLDELARLGVGQDASSGSESAYSARTPEELLSAFGTIIERVRACQFVVDAEVNVERASEGTVILNDQTLLHETDWRLTNDRTLELLGDSCETFKNEAAPSLEASFPCDVATPLL